MKIVQIMPAFVLAGAETMCENLIYQLRDLGHDVTAISMYDDQSVITERLENAGVDIRYLKKRPGLDLSMILKIKRVLEETGADAVHTHLYCAQYAIPAAILAGVKIRVHTVHSVAQKENGKLARKLNGFFFRHCHLMPVALSEQIQNSITEEYGIAKEKLPVIFNGSDLSKCKPKTDYEICGNFKILHVGRFFEPKNHSGLLQAFHLFYAKHPDSELWLVGDGETRPAAEEYVQQNGLSSAVKFYGLQSDVYGYLHDADIFTLPSFYEGISLALIEAMGTGLPVVATAVGGVPDMLSEECALLVPVETEMIAAAFERYYCDPALRYCHGQNARRESVRFSSGQMAKKYEALYSQLAAR